MAKAPGMALCVTCGHECAVSAKACPNCGKAYPTLGVAAKLVAAAVMVSVPLAVVGSCTAWMFSGNEEVTDSLATVELEQPYVPPSVYKGMGIPRASFLKFAEAGLPITFEESPLVDGTPRLLGTMENPWAMLELIGDPHNIRSVGVSFVPTTSDADNAKIGLLALASMKVASPNWPEASDWFLERMDAGIEEASVVRGNRRYTYQRVLGMVNMIVERDQ